MTKQFTFRLIVLTFAVFYFGNAIGQIATKRTAQELTKISMEILYLGNLKLAWQWTDIEGIHVVVAAETGIYENSTFEHENGGQDAQVLVYHYVVAGGKTYLKWSVRDFIKDCVVDLEARFINNTIKITDLNKNGIEEVWMMYVTVCHGDVSPLDMKIIMYEGEQKYAMRGQNKIKFSPNGYMGGDYKFDNAFNDGNATFRSYAKKMWLEHIYGK